MSSRRLSPQQVQVLARLVAGESVTRADSDLRVTVYSLRNRGLVVTSRQPGGGWIAELTAVGREAAATGRVPARLPRPRGRARATAQPSVAGPEQAESVMVDPGQATGDEVPPVRGGRRPSTLSPTRDSVRPTVVQVTRVALRAGRPDERGMLHAQGDGVVAVAVSRAQVGRAVALVDLILRTAERRGMAVAVVPEPGQQWGVRRTVVRIVCQEPGFGFTLSEPATRAANPKAGTSWSQPRWLYTPTGRLHVKLGYEYTPGVSKVRGTFADSARRTAEDKVGELLDEIERRASAEHVRQREEQRLDAVYRQQRTAAVVAARDRFWDDLRATSPSIRCNWSG